MSKNTLIFSVIVLLLMSTPLKIMFFTKVPGNERIRTGFEIPQNLSAQFWKTKKLELYKNLSLFRPNKIQNLDPLGTGVLNGRLSCDLCSTVYISPVHNHFLIVSLFLLDLDLNQDGSELAVLRQGLTRPNRTPTVGERKGDYLWEIALCTSIQSQNWQP